ncbi:Putative SET domain-containing protein [Septoria linicola]|uniref:SET domain-containing protein n=1 Tax=Septoria linicola TaxID=215465 RepID=A0A9Q9EG01_9PEZI|nr:putative SET domain-containing protein [Septoria linicola]USW47793.1 Putative SET domain-containing protein [Septoria linicola]
MSTFLSLSKPEPRAKYTIRPLDIVEVLSHRIRHGTEEYLVRWRTKPAFPCPPRAVASWHSLPELRDALHHIQDYIERDALSGNGTHDKSQTSTTFSRKRKSPEDDGPLARGALGANGLMTPDPRSRSPSIADIDTPDSGQHDGPPIYNGVLQYKEGRIIATKPRSGEVASINTTTLPTSQMQQEASRTSVEQAEYAIRRAFDQKLAKVRKVRLENRFDSTTPSLNFDFIKDYVLREGVSGDTPDTFHGCQKCKANMGGNVGCEYTAICDCLEFAAVDESALKRKDPELYEIYKIATEAARNEAEAAGVDGGRDGIDTTGMPKRFPYSKPKVGGIQTMVSFYREERYPIFECNINCRCGPRCKSRLVQNGRKVPLVIFNTGADQGWGVKCDEDLIQGEFIDVYLGEVITDEETTRREKSSEATKDKASYLFSLDKFAGDRDPTNGNRPLDNDDCYVVDGQYMGNVTRFMNHSCEPNVRQYTVSYNKHDLKLYNLAFFAYVDIPAGTELCFDYAEKDEVELDVAIARREHALADPDNKDKPRCRCGASKCRGILWD